MIKKNWNWFLLALILVGAFLLRVLSQIDKVLVNGEVWYRGVDSWYHMRLADIMYYNFPQLSTFDIFLSYPHGSLVGFSPFMGWIIAAVGKITGINYELVGAYLPPVIGALILIPVYLIAYHLFKSKILGLVACFFVAVLPTEYMNRSLLGFTDHHILEVLFMVLAILFLLYAIPHTNPSKSTPKLLSKKWILWGSLSGGSLGLYLVNWNGGLFFVLILWVWFIIQFLLNYFKNKPVFQLCRLFTLILITSYSLYIPYITIQPIPPSNIAALIIALITPWGLYFLSRLITDKKTFSHLLIEFLLLSIAFISIFIPNFFTFIRDGLGAVFWGFGSSIMEAQPPDMNVYLNSYGIAFFLMFGGFIFYWRTKDKSYLFLIWCFLIFLLGIGQRRWGYYFTINLSILAAFCIVKIGSYIREQQRLAVILVILIFSFFSTVRGTQGVADLPNDYTQDWRDAMVWLNKNTPDPFAGHDMYLGNINSKIYQPTYGIMTWWDYGHWIIRAAKRVPTSNPASWGSYGYYRFMTAQTEAEAEDIIRNRNIKYVIIDSQIVRGKFPAMASLIGLSNWRDALPKSQAYRMYYSNVEGYKVVFRNKEVKIFERLVK